MLFLTLRRVQIVVSVGIVALLSTACSQSMSAPRSTAKTTTTSVVTRYRL